MVTLLQSFQIIEKWNVAKNKKGAYSEKKKLLTNRTLNERKIIFMTFVPTITGVALKMPKNQRKMEIYRVQIIMDTAKHKEYKKKTNHQIKENHRRSII